MHELFCSGRRGGEWIWRHVLYWAGKVVYALHTVQVYGFYLLAVQRWILTLGSLHCLQLHPHLLPTRFKILPRVQIVGSCPNTCPSHAL
eukprot:1159054-Pelagomonas_calceolata.AAC.10